MAFKLARRLLLSFSIKRSWLQSYIIHFVLRRNSGTFGVGKSASLFCDICVDGLDHSSIGRSRDVVGVLMIVDEVKKERAGDCVVHSVHDIYPSLDELLQTYRKSCVYC